MTDPAPNHYGVFVWDDEDGETYYVAGHVPARRAIAAANRCARVDGGLVNLYDEHGALPPSVAHRWTRPVSTNPDEEVYEYVPEGAPRAQPITVVTL